MNYNCIVVLGPTASGKTKFACQVARELGGEIVSADSRQVYRKLDIGTGKDLHEYRGDGWQVPYHLIDITDVSEQFYVHQYIAELKSVFELIHARKKIPVICGGTGLYLDTLHKDFSFTQIKENHELRSTLNDLHKEELVQKLHSYPVEFIEHVDVHSVKRLIRGIEVAEHLLKEPLNKKSGKSFYKPFYIGIRTEREEIKKRISERLLNRLKHGMLEEVQGLLSSGLTHERLQKLGLEYKYISLHLQSKLTFNELKDQLQTAIFQFAKRQMTWFRKMEKEGVKIHWIGSPNEIEEMMLTLKKEFLTDAI